MEIDIFPVLSAKGVHRYIGTTLLGLIIITYIVGAYKIAHQLHIDRTQMAEAKEKQEKDKFDKILRYTRLVFFPHGFSDEELF